MSQLSLFPRQLKFVKDPDRFPAAIGGIGSGKTFVGSAKTISRIGRKELGLVCAPTYKMLRDSTQRTLFEMLGELGIPFNFSKTDNHAYFPYTGHEILFRSLDDPDNLRGPNVAYAWVDEAAYVSAKAWRVVKGRVRAGDLQQAWITTTPKGRNWVWAEWVQSPTHRHRMYRFRTDENVTLDPEYVASLGYVGDFAAQEIGGEFISFEGLVYRKFDRDKHVQRVDTTNWHRAQGGDVGARNPTVVLTVYFSGDGRIHIGREFYQKNMGSTAILEAFLQEFDDEQPEDIWIDPSAAAYINDLEAEGLPVHKANNDIRTGIQTVNSYIEEGRLTVDPSCVHVITEFEQYQYPEEGGKTGNDNPVKQNDHCMDALRYTVMGYTKAGSMEQGAEVLDQLIAQQLVGAS